MEAARRGRLVERLARDHAHEPGEPAAHVRQGDVGAWCDSFTVEAIGDALVVTVRTTLGDVTHTFDPGIVAARLATDGLA